MLLGVPFALTGSVWLLYVLDYNLSIAVWVGIIALAGVSAETGVVMLVYLDLAYKKAIQKYGDDFNQGHLREAIEEGAALRVRPKLMTVVATMTGLMPRYFRKTTSTPVPRCGAAGIAGRTLDSSFRSSSWCRT